MRPWSPHVYRTEGLAQGIDSGTLAASIGEIEAFLAISPCLAPIVSLGHLATEVGVSYKYLRRVVSRSTPNAYVEFALIGKSGRVRRISTPARDLMTTQRWIAVNILADVEGGPNSFAYHRGKSIVDCARRHCGSRWLIKLDVARFFPSISESRVFEIFLALGYRRLVALELARICTWPDYKDDRLLLQEPAIRESGPSYGSARLGQLPIGAPTSPMLSNIFMRSFDLQMSKYCADNGLIFSRYADDIFLSSDDANFTRSKAARTAQAVRLALRSHGLYANDAKEVIVPPGARKVVLGMLVDGPHPRLSREFKKRMKMHYHFIALLGIEAHAEARSFPSVPMLERHLRGLIAFAAQVEPLYADSLRVLHNRHDWAITY